MKNLILILLISFLGFNANAQEITKNKNAKVEFKVSGNCEMCKKRIEKASFKVSGVKSAVWNVDSGVLKLVFNEEKTNIETIQKAIAKVGHDNEGQKASDEVYTSLHTCCQYERK
jgi:periplasmic mercuric ion binding protein